MEEETKKTSHISYKEYQKKVNEKPTDGIVIFVSAFFILLLLFLGIAKQLSPEIDVSIGGDATVEDTQEKALIDERLKLLKDEDDSSTEEKMFNEELEEKVVLPENENKEEVKEISEEEPVTLTEKEAAPKPDETAAPAPQVKVVVGYYSTKEQAEVAKGIITESGMNITPFVKSIGGAYTIQVGSYSTREAAQGVVNDLLRNNYPARIITE